MSAPLTDKINALTALANETTGVSDTTLTDAVKTLIDGFSGENSPLIDDIEFGSFTVPDGESTYAIALHGEYETCPKGVIIFSNDFDILSDKVDKPMLGAFAAVFVEGNPTVPLSSYNNYIFSYYSTYCVNWDSSTKGNTPSWRRSVSEARGIYYYEPSTKELNLRGFGTGEYDFKNGVEYRYFVWGAINQFSDIYPIGEDVVSRYIGRDWSTGSVPMIRGRVNHETGLYEPDENGDFNISLTYLPVSPTYQYTKPGHGGFLYRVLFYDEEKNFISGARFTVNWNIWFSFTVPAEARYMRIATHSSDVYKNVYVIRSA